MSSTMRRTSSLVVGKSWSNMLVLFVWDDDDSSWDIIDNALSPEWSDESSKMLLSLVSELLEFRGEEDILPPSSDGFGSGCKKGMVV